MALPMPLLAPVMKTVLPLKLICIDYKSIYVNSQVAGREFAEQPATLRPATC
jgi:hypothetical protein